MSKAIGFLGLGHMGHPISKNILNSGYYLIIPSYRAEIHTTPQAEVENIEDLLESGARGSSDLKDFAEKSQIIITMLPSSDEVEDVILGEDGLLEKACENTIVIDMTTANPVSTKKVSSKLSEKGILMLDAPVSGGRKGAVEKTLSIMVGGDEEVFEKCRPLLEVIGKKVLHMGPVSSGHTIKLVNNFLSGCATAATTEAMMVAAKAGISPQKALDVLKDSSGKNDATNKKFPDYVLPDKDYNFTYKLLYKDLCLYNQLAEDLDVPSFISNTVSQLWSIPIAKGEGDKDMLNIVNMFEEWCGVKIRGKDTKG